MLEGTPYKRRQAANLFVFAVAPIDPYVNSRAIVTP
jgi:hypothetical protein